MDMQVGYIFQHIMTLLYETQLQMKLQTQALVDVIMDTDEHEHEDREPVKTRISRNLQLLQDNLFEDMNNDNKGYKDKDDQGGRRERG